MEFPQLQIQQTYAKIGIDADPGHWEMYQPQPRVSTQTSPAQFSVEARPANLQMDSSRAWSALGVGSHDDWSHSIYSQSKNVALQGIMRRIEDGNRLANIANPKLAIPELAEKNSKLMNTVEYTTTSQFDGVDINYTPKEISINYQPSRLMVDVVISPPQNQYVRGKLDIYLLQKPGVTITPPQLDRSI